MAERLRVTEIFYSLQGEARTAGRPTIFIRLTGCPLRCGYCDTAYAFQGGDLLRGETGIEAGTIQHGLYGCFERSREGIEWLGKTGMHSVSSKANWAAIVGSPLG